MKKIAILTLNGWYNYGNRLQNYSLQNFLENNFDVNVKTIYPSLLTLNKESDKKATHKFIKFLLENKKLKDKKRYFKFKKFDKIVKYDTNHYTMDNINELNSNYDYFVVGSDQVWNAKHWLRSYLLPGIDKRKKISYAASIARKEINLEEEYFFQKYLDSFRGISVRENFSIETLRHITKNKINCNIDPTFLTSVQEWQYLEKKPKCIGKKACILKCFLSGTNSDYDEIINNIATKYDLEIINIFGEKNNHLTLSPSEFLYLIHHSKLIVTDSFHAVVFSIIFKTPFVHLPTLSSDGYGDMSLRLQNLEDLFNTKFVDLNNIKDSIDDSLFEFKIENSEYIIEKEKKKAINYFNEIFKEDYKSSNNLDDKDFFCSGCGLCSNICPTGAIKYITNKEGFIQKIINQNKCINCGLCVANCPMLKTYSQLEKKDIYILNRKVSLNDTSSSAGVFSALAKVIFKKSGYVFGAFYDKNDNKFIKINKESDLYKIKGSKYYQFNITEIYEEIDELIKNKKYVMVCGTPCQIAGLSQRFVNSEFLILVQLICHGVTSKNIFDACCKEKYGDNPNNINFKYHYPSWDNYSVKYTFTKKEEIISEREDLFMRYYLSDIALNDSCYNCRFAGREIGSDIIIGDCWGVNSIDKKMYDKEGVSIVKINSLKGNEIFKHILDKFNYKKVPSCKIKYCNENMFSAFKRERQFFEKGRFFKILEKGELKSYEDYMIKVEKQNEVINISNKSLKSFIKKVIKKLIKY